MSQSANRNLLLELLFLALIIFLAHYLHFRSFGLYEDDYSHTSLALGWRISDLVGWSLDELRYWDLGRPLGYILGPALAFLGARLGGLGMMYIVAYLVQVTNAILFYVLLRRIGHGSIALLGALAFGLFPADTTHTFLMHALGLHTSLTFLLLASHCYLSDRKFPAYLLSLGCLLIYESPYMLFLGVPLLLQEWDARLVREWLRHAGIWLGILLVVAASRALMGEGRIEVLGSSATHLRDVARQILAASVIGPAVSLSMFWRGPSWTLSHWNPELTIVFLLCLPLFIWMVSRLRANALQRDPAASVVLPFRVPGQAANPRLTIPRPQTVKLALAGFVTLILAYGFSFTHYPPTATYGRLTSVHLAAAFGSALLFAALASLLLTLPKRRWLRLALTALLACYLSWVVAYRFSIQQDFVKAWQNQRAFWSAVVQQAPDLQDGTIILVTGSLEPGTHFISTLSWANPLVLEQIFRFPASWSTPPRLFVVSPNWSKLVIRENGQLLWPVPAATWGAHWEVLPDSNVVLLGVRNGELYRQFGSLPLNRLTLNLKPLPRTSSPPWPPGPLYRLLVPNTQ